MDHLSSNIVMCAMLLLFYASGTVEGAAFSESCTVNTNCIEDHNECNSATSTCACLSTAFRNKDNNACVPKVALDIGCADAGDPAAQCLDDLAECKDMSGSKCLCKDNNYRSDSACKAQVAIGDTCEKDDTATDQCSVTNTACSDDGAGANKCLCTSAYYESGSTCHNRKKPDEACAETQCVANAVCSTSKCACNTGYTATPTTTPTSCESSDATIIIAHMYLFMFGIVASLYFLV